MLRWKLRTVMADRKISNKQLAQHLGLHRNTVQQLRDDRPTMIRFEYLESLCELLQCEPSDLFEFQPDSQEVSLGTVGE